MSTKAVVTLRGWRYWETNDPMYNRDHVLTGKCYGHPRPYLLDGEPITTSKIVGRQGKLIETQNTLYRLYDWSGEGLDKDQLLELLEGIDA